MKKHLIPTLLLLSLTGLTACGGDNGLVKGGVALKDANITSVGESVKSGVEGKVKTVTEKDKTDIVMKAKYGNKTEKSKQATEGTYVIDFDQKTIDAKYSTNQGGEKTEYKVKVKQAQDGSFVYVSGDAASPLSDGDTLAALYETATTNIYSWNYEMDDDSILALVGSSAQMDEGTAQETLKAVQTLYANIKVSGDVTTGNYEVGLSEPTTFVIDLSSLSEEASALGMSKLPVKVTKMKSVYKEGLLRSSVSAAEMKMSLLGIDMTINMTQTASFTYEMK